MMRREALYVAAELGPIVPLSDRRIPLVKLDRATTDPEVIYEWWTQWPDAGIGLVAWLSTLMVIDIEHPSKGGEDGFATMRRLEETIGPLPETRSHSTKSGGRHLVFSLPREAPVRSAQGFIRGLDVTAAGVDIVAGVAVLRWPPTRGYALERDAEIAPLPEQWLSALSDPPIEFRTAPVIATGDRARNYAIAALADEAAAFASRGDGRRVALNTAAFSMGQLCPPLAMSEVVDALMAACRINGAERNHGKRWCEQTIVRSVKSGMRQPRRLAA